MSEKMRAVPVGPTTILPDGREQRPAGWPQWMQEALAHEPETKNAHEVGGVDDPARDDRASVRILSRVSPRS